MNYFAHGHRFVDRPWFLAGTAAPDWLATSDRSARWRLREVERYAGGIDSAQAELAAGVLRHLEDDRRFHSGAAFKETSAAVARFYREALGSGRHRTWFLGHVTVELLLDGELIERAPGGLDAYYGALAILDPSEVQVRVGRMVSSPVARLGGFVERFVDARFLADYGDDSRLRFRLNQVLGRVNLPPLAASVEPALAESRRLVRSRAAALLTRQTSGT